MSGFFINIIYCLHKILIFPEWLECIAFGIEGWPRGNRDGTVEERRKGRCCDEKGEHRIAHSILR